MQSVKYLCCMIAHVPCAKLFDLCEIELQQAVRPREQFLPVKRYEHMSTMASLARRYYLDSPIVQFDKYGQAEKSMELGV